MPQNIKALKARIRSVESTKHITKAMELVASSKIKKATAKMDGSRFYRSVMEEAFRELAAADTPYSRPLNTELPTLYIAIAGDRGLAGGYNNGIFKAVRERLRPGDKILPIGKRSAEYFAHHGAVFGDYGRKILSSEDLRSEDCAKIGREVTSAFDRGEFGAIYLVATEFISMLTQEVRCDRLLPLTVPSEAGKCPPVQTVYEPDAETVLSALIPEYIAGVLYSAGCMAFTAELAARRQAMDTATKNAEEMIDELNLRYNRARQGAITQEITEIIAGSNA